MTTVYLVSCVGKKADAPIQAADLYLSDWFIKARGYVESLGAEWYILSAEYGFLRRDQVTAPYEKTLNAMPRGARRAWAEGVARTLIAAFPPRTHFVFLAGDRYRADLIPLLESAGHSCAVPMRGLGIGQQLAWLKSHQPQGES